MNEDMPMMTIDKTWKVMNDLEDAFSQITTFSFLLDKLQEAVDAGDTQRIVDTTAALNAFYPPYCDNWDDKYAAAWRHVVKSTVPRVPDSEVVSPVVN